MASRNAQRITLVAVPALTMAGCGSETGAPGSGASPKPPVASTTVATEPAAAQVLSAPIYEPFHVRLVGAADEYNTSGRRLRNRAAHHLFTGHQGTAETTLVASWLPIVLDVHA